jgi:hypothetical protein
MLMRWLGIGGSGLALALLLACGGKSSSNGGMAGTGAHGLPIAGEPCQNGLCAQGLSCESGGAFHGLCTASCSSDPGCGLLNPRAHCFGMMNQECAVACTIDTQCPNGTHCAPLGGFGSTRACQLP